MSATYSLVEQRKLVCPPEHRQHEHEDCAGRGDLGPVLEDDHWDEGLGVEIPFPGAESNDEQAAEDEEEDDSPVWWVNDAGLIKARLDER